MKIKTSAIFKGSVICFVLALLLLPLLFYFTIYTGSTAAATGDTSKYDFFETLLPLPSVLGMVSLVVMIVTGSMLLLSKRSHKNKL